MKFKDATEAYRQKLHMDGRLTMDTERRLAILEERWAKEELDDITPRAVQEYVYHKYQGRSPATINRNLNVFVAVLGYAEEMGMMEKKPRIRRRRGEVGRDVHLEVDEIMPVVEYVRVSGNALMGFCVLLLIDTGMRLGEALHLRWGDLSAEWVNVRLNANGNSKTVARRIPMSPRLLEYMRKYKVLPLSTDTPQTKIVLSRWNEVGRVIGRRLNDALREACVATGAQCGMDIRVHDLRHTFAYLCASAGADLGDIKELLGHKHVNVTMRYRGFVKTRAMEIIRKGMAANG